MKQFTACRKCANLKGPKAGFYYKGDYVVECECHQKYREELLVSLRAKNASVWQTPPDITKSYKGTKSLKSRDNFTRYIEQFKKFQDKCVYMYGPNGTQKTSIAMWGAKKLLQQGWKVQYILMYRLLELLTSRFEAQQQAGIELNFLKKSDLLIIDEAFTKDKVLLYKSGYQLPFLDSFLRERIDLQKKGTLFISNKHSSEIEQEGFGKSLQDLIVRNTKQTELEFLDNYVANNINDFDSRSIFEK